MATIGFNFNNEDAGNVLEVCWRSNTGQIKMTPVDVILAEADLPTVATRATQLSKLAVEKYL